MRGVPLACEGDGCGCKGQAQGEKPARLTIRVLNVRQSSTLSGGQTIDGPLSDLLVFLPSRRESLRATALPGGKTSLPQLARATGGRDSASHEQDLCHDRQGFICRGSGAS